VGSDPQGMDMGVGPGGRPRHLPDNTGLRSK
jgi:hypothetical protein